MTRKQVVAYSGERTGHRITNREWIWYEVFGLFRVAVIAQQVYARYMAKQTTNMQFRLFGIAVVVLELRCRRIIARARPAASRGAGRRSALMTVVRPSSLD